MHRWADFLEADAPTLARLEAICSTRPVGQLPAGDIAVTAEQIRFFAEMADKEGGDLVPTAAGALGMTVTEPYGASPRSPPGTSRFRWLAGSSDRRSPPATPSC
jgi:aldehyde dehydrogenase (NAD+)